MLVAQVREVNPEHKILKIWKEQLLFQFFSSSRFSVLTVQVGDRVWVGGTKQGTVRLAPFL
jgi:hypothetical protein